MTEGVRRRAPVTVGDVTDAAAQCTQFLSSSIDADWSAPIPGMELTITQAVAHISEGLLMYAVDLSSGAREITTLDVRVKPESSSADLVAILVAAARVVSRVIATAPPDVLGFHPLGSADPEGYAAMACDEMLIHTDDAAHGLGRVFEPDEALCARVHARLFPDALVEASPWDALRWANGRLALPGYPRREKWRWYSAPRD